MVFISKYISKKFRTGSTKWMDPSRKFEFGCLRGLFKRPCWKFLYIRIYIYILFFFIYWSIAIYVFTKKMCYGQSIYTYIHISKFKSWHVCQPLPAVAPHSFHCKSVFQNKSILLDLEHLFWVFLILLIYIYIFQNLYIPFHIGKGAPICRDVCWRGEPMLGGQSSWLSVSSYWHSLCWEFWGIVERAQDEPFRHHVNLWAGVPLSNWKGESNMGQFKVYRLGLLSVYMDRFS